MATPTSTFITYDAIGNREDLSDVIYNVDPTVTPLLSNSRRTTASAVLHEWQTDSIDAPGANAVLEGDDATTDSTTATARVSNTCQISDKVPRVSGTQQAVVSAGRREELAYQISLKGAALKLDMEYALTQNGAEATGDTTNARTLGGLRSWIITNDVFASDGASGTGLGNTARTDGTQRAFTEAQLKAALLLCYNAGGDPDCLMVGPFNKQVASGFTGNATRTKDAMDKTLQAAIDIYDSDFGEIEIIPNRVQRARDAWLLQKDMLACAYLRPFRLYDLAKTGDSERKQLLAEYTLEVSNEAAHGMVADLTTS